jgi:hypothetical protein
MEELDTKDPIIQLPTDFIMIGGLPHPSGLAHALHQPKRSGYMEAHCRTSSQRTSKLSSRTERVYKSLTE